MHSRSQLPVTANRSIRPSPMRGVRADEVGDTAGHPPSGLPEDLDERHTSSVLPFTKPRIEMSFDVSDRERSSLEGNETMNSTRFAKTTSRTTKAMGLGIVAAMLMGGGVALADTTWSTPDASRPRLARFESSTTRPPDAQQTNVASIGTRPAPKAPPEQLACRDPGAIPAVPAARQGPRRGRQVEGSGDRPRDVPPGGAGEDLGAV